MSDDLALSSTPRTTIGRLRERGLTDRADLHAVLDAGLICHLGVVIDGTPVVLPTGYGRRGNTLYLHGSSANRSLLAADGQEICVTVTLVDGLVCARSVFHHSMNYRSAVVLGTARAVTGDDERLAALRAVTEQLAPGRWEHTRPPTRKELAATAVLALPLDEASVKVRAGQPSDDPEDYESDIWAGVIPAALTFGQAEPDPALDQDIQVPEHILAMAGRARGAAGSR
jgi:nitroimidazol reductase NimA-like FMN-containing flavoprotein (pyridoxamine 5'-phosphate oxidase superfamily)